MATTYRINIKLSDDTLTSLSEQGMFLCAYKGVQTKSKGGQLPLWFATDNLAESVTISWQEQYGGYTQHGELEEGAYINATSAKTMELGDKLTIASSGVPKVTTDGAKGCIVVAEDLDSSKSWLAGMAQVVGVGKEAVLTPTCAFTLNPGEAITMEPLEIVLLEFRSDITQVGTVVASTSGSCMLFTLTGEMTTASGVEYDAFSSYPQWTNGGLPWGEPFPAQTDLAKHLISS